MTRFSPPIVHKCPACTGYVARHALISMFMDGLDHWSDGCSSGIWNFMHGPVARCPQCAAVFWWEDTSEIQRLTWAPRSIGPIMRALIWLTGDRSGRLKELREWQSIADDLKNAERADTPDYADLCRALAQLDPPKPAREMYLRHKIWWLSNNHLRYRDPKATMATPPAVPEDEAVANILRLLELYEHDLKHQVERGELLRQLGRFDEAVAVLKAVKPDGYSEVKAVKIERLALARNADLQAI
ncbi:tetratricopeptide repeat protein [Rugamonas rivuli]|uniref:Tetratricopeptide repeat protein n=1 Tax=Rugamonas rivuli TaxID=2743358 RepID=A0A843SK54_9BURK|nr:hypothetical protein [Rugamonas rivuli]MQA23652.1 hypothetical protein [Rugamonas rivuli]